MNDQILNAEQLLGKKDAKKIIAKLSVEQLGDNKLETLNKCLAAQNFMRLDLSHLQS